VTVRSCPLCWGYCKIKSVSSTKAMSRSIGALFF